MRPPPDCPRAEANLGRPRRPALFKIARFLVAVGNVMIAWTGRNLLPPVFPKAGGIYLFWAAQSSLRRRWPPLLAPARGVLCLAPFLRWPAIAQ
ncbi:MAG TPA: hypothetical protein VHY20_08660 [Pirellulales bacterium]|jgi:hypothetical protein|nr:hypothetical protein [Pirellulales bacterium]